MLNQFILKRTARRGFTLLEMMLVVMIIGVLIGVAAWNIGSQGTKARRAATVATMKTVESMLKTYNLDYGMYPPTVNALVPKYTEKVPVDAWKRPIVYAANPVGSPKPYTMYSPGENGQAGDNDDIDIWTVDEQPN